MSQHPQGRFEPGFDLLTISLSAAVPLRILEIVQAGGPTESDLARARSSTADLTANGADLFFRSRVKGASAERFNQVAEAIAVLSFQPGGVSAFGMHFDGNEMWANREAMQQRAEEEP
jgi:hypothetical protein